MSKYEMPGDEASASAKELSLRKEEIEKKEREQWKKEIVALVRELDAGREFFSFPGIDHDSYQKLKSEEEMFPGCVTSIDELMQRFKREGIKAVLGDDPESGNVYILPRGSDDVRNDGIFPKHLQIVENMDKRLKKLILMSRVLMSWG